MSVSKAKVRCKKSKVISSDAGKRKLPESALGPIPQLPFSPRHHLLLLPELLSRFLSRDSYVGN